MGASKSYRKGPGWQERNTPGADPKVSKGAIVKAEGTHVSGPSDFGRTGMKNSARQKSKSGSTPAKNSGPYGRS